MSGEEEEAPEQPLWQSVLLFCCKGVIEGIIVILFFWLLVQVLFTKDLEVHLQVLLGVGLLVFCVSLLIGCLLCLCRMRLDSPEDKDTVTSPPASSNTAATADRTTQSLTSSVSSSEAAPARAQYEDLEAEELDLHSASGSSLSSDENLAMLPLDRRLHGTTAHEGGSCFPLRRLSSPLLSPPLYLALDRTRCSLPSLPKLNLLAKTRKVLERRCTVSGHGYPYGERRRLTSPSPCSPGTPVQNRHLLQGGPGLPHYGSNALCCVPAPPPPSLTFTLTLSLVRRSLTLSLLRLTGAPWRQGGWAVLASLPPLHPTPREVNVGGEGSALEVGGLAELRGCVLRLGVVARGERRDPSLGHLEIQCQELDWDPDTPVTCTRTLTNYCYLNTLDEV